MSRFLLNPGPVPVLLGLLTFLTLGSGARADEPPPNKAEAVLPTGALDAKDYLKQPTTPLEPGELDRLVEGQLKQAGIQPAPLTTDEQFIRRAWLDLTGRMPSPTEVSAFLADQSPDKRAKLIDRLLDSDEYARHWAMYWRGVISNRTTDFRANYGTRGFERWLTEQFKENTGWGKITRDILTASGEVRPDEPDKNGPAYFLATRFGGDAQVELAAETSRIFLGIQIQCAQCHDHPSDVWQRKQFHEFAAYFSRIRQRAIREQGNNRILGTQLVSLPTGEYQMPDPENPRRRTVMQPRFLDGKAPGQRLSDLARRRALTDSITSKNNPWFAAAFVNRMWGELMGQAFYQPIDDLGPLKEAVMPEVLARVSASFRGSDYDIKQLLRDLMNSETYQRQIRPGDSPDEHLLFAGRNPVRMDANSLWNTLVATLGPITPGGGRFGGKGPAAGGAFRGGQFSIEGQFKAEFGFDPSTKAEEIETSISQALLLMNNPAINQKIQARGNNMLTGILARHSADDEALRQVYLRTLARRPTDRELTRCQDHIQSVGNRAEAYEDILWALINSTEFQTKR